MSSTIHIVRIPVDPTKPIEQVFIRNDLRAYQAEVDGFIERVRITPYLNLWCNEDGISKRLEPNVRASILAHQTILGDTFLSGQHPDQSDDGVEHDVAPGTADLLTRFFEIVVVV